MVNGFPYVTQSWVLYIVGESSMNRKYHTPRNNCIHRFKIRYKAMNANSVDCLAEVVDCGTRTPVL